MQSYNRRAFLETSCLAAGAWFIGGRDVRAAIAPGVETVASPLIAGEEASAQPDLWAMEVWFKPVRMIYVPVTDPKTGKTRKELVWYIAYRALVRPSSRVPDSAEGAPDRPIFVPEFTLVSDDKGKLQSYADRILPEAQKAINKRERYNYKNSVDVVGPLPPVTPEGSKQPKTLDGVATWTGIDPTTDYFTIYMTGFSNGYKVSQGPDGQEIVLRRTLMQKFWRPSDPFDQSEDEIRMKGEPAWVYR